MDFFVAYTKIASTVFYKVHTDDWKTFHLTYFNNIAWRGSCPKKLTIQKVRQKWVCDLKPSDLVKNVQEQIEAHAAQAHSHKFGKESR